MTTPRRPRSALAPVPAALDVEERVAVVLGEMRAGRWGRQRCAELAAAWQVTESTVRRAAAEAARTIRAAVGVGHDEMIATVLGRLDRIYTEAMEAGDHKAATLATRTLAEVSGIAGVLQAVLDTPDSVEEERKTYSPEVERVFKNPAACLFYTTHGLMPMGALAQELFSGERDPYAPCRRDGCEFCRRFHNGRPASPVQRPS